MHVVFLINTYHVCVAKRFQEIGVANYFRIIKKSYAKWYVSNVLLIHACAGSAIACYDETK